FVTYTQTVKAGLLIKLQRLTLKYPFNIRPVNFCPIAMTGKYALCQLIFNKVFKFLLRIYQYRNRCANAEMTIPFHKQDMLTIKLVFCIPNFSLITRF